MPAEPISSSGLRPILSITAMVTKQAAIETAPDTMLISKRLALGEAGELPQRRAVIEDDVDADELLEGGEHDPDPDDRANAAAARLPLMSLRRGRWSSLKVARISSSLARATSAPNRLVRTLVGLVGAALGDEVARAFRDQEKRDEEDRRRDRLHQEHPAPRLDSAPEARRRNAGASWPGSS